MEDGYARFCQEDRLFGRSDGVHGLGHMRAAPDSGDVPVSAARRSAGRGLHGRHSGQQDSAQQQDDQTDSTRPG